MCLSVQLDSRLIWHNIGRKDVKEFYCPCCVRKKKAVPDRKGAVYCSDCGRIIHGREN